MSVSPLATATVTSTITAARCSAPSKQMPQALLLPAPAIRRGAGSERLIGRRQLRNRLVLLLPVADLDQLDVEAERLQLADQHIERLGHTRLDGCLALDDGL